MSQHKELGGGGGGDAYLYEYTNRYKSMEDHRHGTEKQLLYISSVWWSLVDGFLFLFRVKSLISSRRGKK